MNIDKQYIIDNIKNADIDNKITPIVLSNILENLYDECVDVSDNYATNSSVSISVQTLSNDINVSLGFINSNIDSINSSLLDLSTYVSKNISTNIKEYVDSSINLLHDKLETEIQDISKNSKYKEGTNVDITGNTISVVGYSIDTSKNMIIEGDLYFKYNGVQYNLISLIKRIEALESTTDVNHDEADSINNTLYYVIGETSSKNVELNDIDYLKTTIISVTNQLSEVIG